MFEIGGFGEEDADTTGDGDGDDGTEDAEDVHADDDGYENHGDGELELATLDMGGDDVAFYLLINEIEDGEGEGGAGGAKEDEDANYGAADDGADHGDHVGGHGDEAHGDGETHGEMENDTKEGDYGGYHDAV